MAAIPWRPFNLRGIKMKGLLALLIFLWSFLHMPVLLSTGRVLFTGRAQRSDGAVDEPGKSFFAEQAWIDDGDTSLPPEKIQVPSC